MSACLGGRDAVIYGGASAPGGAMACCVTVRAWGTTGFSRARAGAPAAPVDREASGDHEEAA